MYGNIIKYELLIWKMLFFRFHIFCSHIYSIRIMEECITWQEYIVKQFFYSIVAGVIVEVYVSFHIFSMCVMCAGKYTKILLWRVCSAFSKQKNCAPSRYYIIYSIICCTVRLQKKNYFLWEFTWFLLTISLLCRIFCKISLSNCSGIQ